MRRALALISVVMVACLSLAMPVEAAIVMDRPMQYVALGDEFVATTEPMPGGHQADCLSRQAGYAAQVAQSLVGKRSTQLTVVACHGVTINGLYDSRSGQPSQISRLRRDTELVTVTVGAYDLGLPSYLATCLESECPAASTNAVLQAITPVSKQLQALVSDMRERSPQAQIVVVGYGQAVSRRMNYPGDSACQGLTLAERRSMEIVWWLVDHAMRRVVTDLRDQHARYVSGYDDHKRWSNQAACDGPKALYTRLATSPLPLLTLDGQKALAQLVRNRVG